VAIGKALVADGSPATPLAFAAITAVLREVLANGLIRYSRITRLEDVQVTVLPPDRVTVGTDEPNQINLFMYRVAPHSKLRSVRPPEAGAPPRRPPLPLDLHYLVTAYGGHDFHSEVLLGCAVHLLNSTPVLIWDGCIPFAEGIGGKRFNEIRDALLVVSAGPLKSSVDLVTDEDVVR